MFHSLTPFPFLRKGGKKEKLREVSKTKERWDDGRRAKMNLRRLIGKEESVPKVG
jgi:hypothetical protein